MDLPLEHLPSARMKTIVVVDDEVGIAETLGTVLGDEGYRVLLAVNGRQALEVVRAANPRPDLILLDYMMPLMNGAETYAALQADPVLASIPVVMMSAVAPSTVRVQLGRDAFLEKPFELDQLLALIERRTSPATGR
jgi:CheY-like chemotaxis protein